MPHPWTSSNRVRYPFALVPVDVARRHTGLELRHLLALPDVQLVTRIYADGRREEALRLPAELAPRA